MAKNRKGIGGVGFGMAIVLAIDKAKELDTLHSVIHWFSTMTASVICCAFIVYFLWTEDPEQHLATVTQSGAGQKLAALWRKWKPGLKYGSGGLVALLGISLICVQVYQVLSPLMNPPIGPPLLNPEIQGKPSDPNTRFALVGTGHGRKIVGKDLRFWGYVAMHDDIGVLIKGKKMTVAEPVFAACAVMPSFPADGTNQAFLISDLLRANHVGHQAISRKDPIWRIFIHYSYTDAATQRLAQFDYLYQYGKGLGGKMFWFAIADPERFDPWMFDMLRGSAQSACTDIEPTTGPQVP